MNYAMLVKLYGPEKKEARGPEWYGPAEVVVAMPTPIMGSPKMKWISTFYIERSNPSMRRG